MWYPLGEFELLVLQIVGLFYIAIILGLCWLVYALYKTIKKKINIWMANLFLISLAIMFVFAFILPNYRAYQKVKVEKAEEKVKMDARNAFREKAYAHFEEMCKTAGFFIYKEVPKQQSVLIINPRLKKPDIKTELADQYWTGDPYSVNSLGGSYNSQFDSYLFPRHKCKVTPVLDENGNYITEVTPTGKSRKSIIKTLDFEPYFKFIEVPNQENPQQMMRYSYIETGETRGYPGACSSEHPDYAYHGEPIKSIQSEYGYKTEDISTKADRDLWVAGSRLQIIHLTTGEVVAERIGYLFDSDLGINKYMPAWRAARVVCPNDNNYVSTIYDDNFIIHVLSEKIPKLDNYFSIQTGNKSHEQ